MNKKIIKYTVVRFSSTVYLSHEVDEMIRRGWQPIGGVYVDGNFYLQSMVMYEQ